MLPRPRSSDQLGESTTSVAQGAPPRGFGDRFRVTERPFFDAALDVAASQRVLLRSISDELRAMRDERLPVVLPVVPALGSAASAFLFARGGWPPPSESTQVMPLLTI